MSRQRRSPISPNTYHQGNGDYRNIAIPKLLHRRVSHIALDHDISVSEICACLVELFCVHNEKGPDAPLNFHDFRASFEQVEKYEK